MLSITEALEARRKGKLKRPRSAYGSYSALVFRLLARRYLELLKRTKLACLHFAGSSLCNELLVDGHSERCSASRRSAETDRLLCT